MAKRLTGRGNKPDSAAIAFKKDRWTLAIWWPATGRLKIGPNMTLARTLPEAWEQVQGWA